LYTYGLCGRTLKHSYSKIIHNLLGNELYELFSLERDSFYELFESRNFKAVNVTIPYKKDALSLCDVVSDKAKAIGSVNTVVNKDGLLCGYNTDYEGFVYMLKRAKISLEGKKVLILGTGGTSLTANAVAKGENAREIITVSRKGKVDYTNVYDIADAEVIINTTPVGMYPDNGRAAVDISRFQKLSGVVDVIYNPLKTELLHNAERLGIPCTGGLPMLVAQAVRAHEKFFDVTVPDSVIEIVLFECIESALNVVLVGMPGCGKTSVGKKFAKLSDRVFLDTDEFVEQCGMKIPEIFEKFGEGAFREKETQALRMLSALSGKVIATGGGAVLREENIKLMKQNGIIVYVKRSLDKLSTDGRPLSQGGKEKTARLYEERHGIYESVSDVCVETLEDVEGCAERLNSLIKQAIPEIFGVK